jgi:threonine/homoserine/homoserine lactone efflux protein
MLSAVLGFAVVAGMLTLVPGLDTALIVRASVSHGRRAGFATMWGVSAGVLAWGAAAAAGASALLTASEVAYNGLRLAGAGYLLWMGLRMLWGTRNAAVANATSHHDAAFTPLGTGAFRRGLVTNLLNPKVGVFYMALLPQFIPTGSPVLPTGVMLALVHVAEGVAWYSVLIWGSHMMRAGLARPSVRQWTDRVTGVALTGLGLKVALERH